MGYDHEREQSLVETTEVEKNRDTNNNQNLLPNSNGPIELIDLENTSQEHNSLLNSNIKDGSITGEGLVLPDQLPSTNLSDRQANSGQVDGNRKSTVPCPFLTRRGHCVKGINCDFFHSNKKGNTNEHEIFAKPKHLVLCPFLKRKGSCLKGLHCDFSHDINHFRKTYHPNFRENLPFFGPLQNMMFMIKEMEQCLERRRLTSSSCQPTPGLLAPNCRPSMIPNPRQLQPLMNIPYPHH